MRILITNNTLASRAGSELYVRDVALALKRRGHQPIAYSPRLGEIAEELRAAQISVFDDLKELDSEPDVIHGQHHLETLTALHYFPKTPAIHFCHGAKPWEETPLVHPRILRYVAVDQPCYERLANEGGIEPERIVTLFNFVDLERFQPRLPLPAKPQRALVFSNYASEHTHLRAVRAACDQANLRLDVIGINSGNICANPENELGKYDLVFAKARSAIEALAVGNAVILCDFSGVGPLVTMQNLEQLRPLNFGFKTMSQPLNAEPLINEISRYDATDAQRVSEKMRAEAGLDPAIDRLLALYCEILAEAKCLPQFVRSESDPATAHYLKWLSQRLFEYYGLAHNNDILRARANDLETDRGQLITQLAGITQELTIQRTLQPETIRTLLIKELKQSSPHLLGLYRKLKSISRFLR